MLDQHLSDDVLAYGSVSRGYKSAAFKTLPLDSPPAKPETIDAYELGLKSEFFDRHVRVNGALFWNEIKDPQVLTVVTRGLVIGIDLTNAQKARVKGGEIGIEAAVVHGLKLRGAATYLDAKYRRYGNAPFYTQGPTTISGPTVGDASGNRLPNASKWRFDAGANYALTTGIGVWVADASVAYTGRFAWTPDNAIFEKAYTLVNASITFTPDSARWLTLTAWGKNLGGVKYYSITQEAAGPLGTGGFQAGAAAPRTYGGSIGFKF